MRKALFSMLLLLVLCMASVAAAQQGLLVTWDTPTHNQQGLLNTDQITGYAVYVDDQAPAVVPARQPHYLITNPIPDHTYTVTVTVLFQCQTNYGLGNCEGQHSDLKTYEFIDQASTAPQWVVLK